MGIVVSYIRDTEQSPEFVPFMQDDIDNIRRKWVIPQAKPMDVGEKILFSFFEAWPHYQNYFEHFKNSPLLTLKGAPGFRTHACRMIRIFDATVKILDQDDYELEMERIWVTIARSHFQLNIPKKAFRDFKKVTVEELHQLCDLSQAECSSFNKFFTNIQFVIFEAMDNMNKAERRH